MKACIICQGELKSESGAARVKEDGVIKAIRAVKQALKLAKNHELYVCADHMAEYSKKRKAFEKDILIYSIIAALVFLGFTILPLLNGTFTLGLLVMALLVAVFILLFAVIFRYVPSLEAPPVLSAGPVPSAKAAAQDMGDGPEMEPKNVPSLPAAPAAQKNARKGGGGK
ncbi:MAG: hypothetical protein ACP5NX_04140 [Candidatus Bilamarchaeaceae archaeon]